MKSYDPWNTILVDESGDVVWPQLYYGQSFYQEVPSWIHYDDDDSTQRLLFDGAFIGADSPSAPVTVKKVFDEGQVLHVEICVDGKCYRTSMNLGPAIEMVMQKLAQWHKTQHETAPRDIVGAVDSAIGAAADTMTDVLVRRHVRAGISSPVVGSFWDDVGKAVSSIAESKTTSQFIHDHGLEPYVNLASQAVATYYGGSSAGAAASALSPVVTKLGVADKDEAASAKQALHGVTTLARQHSPEMARAVDVAKGSIRGVATAYHIKRLLELAQGGDTRARRALRRLQSLAAAGNVNAQKALQAVQVIHQQQAMPAAVSGWYDVVGAVVRAGCGPCEPQGLW